MPPKGGPKRSCAKRMQTRTRKGGRPEKNRPRELANICNKTTGGEEIYIILTPQSIAFRGGRSERRRKKPRGRGNWA